MNSLTASVSYQQFLQSQQQNSIYGSSQRTDAQYPFLLLPQFSAVGKSSSLAAGKTEIKSEQVDESNSNNGVEEDEVENGEDTGTPEYDASSQSKQKKHSFVNKDLEKSLIYE
jgi:hypothetical protein